MFVWVGPGAGGDDRISGLGLKGLGLFGFDLEDLIFFFLEEADLDDWWRRRFGRRVLEEDDRFERKKFGSRFGIFVDLIIDNWGWFNEIDNYLECIKLQNSKILNKSNKK